MLASSGSTSLGEKVQDIALLQAQGGDGGQDASNKERAMLALGAKTASTPKHCAPQAALSQIVGRFDAVDRNKGPQCILHFQEVAAGLTSLGLFELSAFQQG